MYTYKYGWPTKYTAKKLFFDIFLKNLDEVSEASCFIKKVLFIDDHDRRKAKHIIQQCSIKRKYILKSLLEKEATECR